MVSLSTVKLLASKYQDIKASNSARNIMKKNLHALENKQNTTCDKRRNILSVESKHKIFNQLSRQILLHFKIVLSVFFIVILVPTAQAYPVTLPTNNCTWNWKHFTQSPTPTAKYLNNDMYNHTTYFFEQVTDPVGSGSWYDLKSPQSFTLPNGPNPTQTYTATEASYDSIGNTPSDFASLEDIESTHKFTAEQFYGAGRFLMNPGVNQTVTFTDSDRLEGHSFAAYNSSGEQIGRSPALALGITTPHYYASENSPADPTLADGIQADATDSYTLNFVVPSDGVVFIHYLISDERTLTSFAVNDFTCLMPELTTTKSASVGSINNDGSFDVTYTVTVENTGGLLFNSMSLVDDLTDSGQLDAAFLNIPTSGVPVVSGTGANLPAANLSYDGGQTDANLVTGAGELAVGETMIVTFTAKLDAAATSAWQNSATATGSLPGGDTFVDDSDNSGGDGTDGPDTDPSNDADATNTDNSTVIIPPSVVDLNISKTVNDSTPNVGDTVTFSLEVENLGPDAATDVLVIDVVTAGFTYVAGSMTGISPTVAGITTDESSPTGTGLKWTIDHLTDTASTTVTFQAVVNTP